MLILKPTLSKGRGSGCSQIRQSRDEPGVQRQTERTGKDTAGSLSATLARPAVLWGLISMPQKVTAGNLLNTTAICLPCSKGTNEKVYKLKRTKGPTNGERPIEREKKKKKEGARESCKQGPSFELPPSVPVQTANPRPHGATYAGRFWTRVQGTGVEELSVSGHDGSCSGLCTPQSPIEIPEAARRNAKCQRSDCTSTFSDRDGEMTAKKKGYPTSPVAKRPGLITRHQRNPLSGLRGCHGTKRATRSVPSPGHAAPTHICQNQQYCISQVSSLCGDVRGTAGLTHVDPRLACEYLHRTYTSLLFIPQPPYPPAVPAPSHKKISSSSERHSAAQRSSKLDMSAGDFTMFSSTNSPASLRRGMRHWQILNTTEGSMAEREDRKGGSYEGEGDERPMVFECGTQQGAPLGHPHIEGSGEYVRGARYQTGNICGHWAVETGDNGGPGAAAEPWPWSQQQSLPILVIQPVADGLPPWDIIISMACTVVQTQTMMKETVCRSILDRKSSYPTISPKRCSDAAACLTMTPRRCLPNSATVQEQRLGSSPVFDTIFPIFCLTVVGNV
ncbi:hypothetical protein EYF80_005098 [Liparis tanakae]|uniref:Uncharacterized protein n=1 Tax=Liparis tanakae TaxID=230148 RepID=A0A4Z2J597_9TELE|nr:hypothetical protein EYF80_005098 [Liparis tanakae]